MSDSRMVWLRMSLVATLLVGCSNSAPPRAQFVVIVDTDAPVPGQVINEGPDGSISLDATIDTVRIDRLDDDEEPICLDSEVCVQQFVVPDPSSWPLSFGVETPAGKAGTTLHLQVRAFPILSAVSGTLTDVQTGVTVDTTDPPPETTIARLVDLVLPESDVVTVSLLLAADCRNTPPSFTKPAPLTCVDDPLKPGAPSGGIEEISAGEPMPPSRVGTWALARAVDCSTPPPTSESDVVCIPGGFSMIGDTSLTGADPVIFTPAFPPRPVYVSPFYLDRTEVTVRRFRQLVVKGLIQLNPGDVSMPDASVATLAQCTWLGDNVATNDLFPLNCISWERAQEVCEIAGGNLPTEAQWEYAARGRGQGRPFPWGAQPPACCTASVARESTGVPQDFCPGFGPEPVGSHPISAACNNTGDESRDGVFDLGGSVAEFCLDHLVSYSEGCWNHFGIFKNPICEDQSTDAHASRGGDWTSGPEISRTALRRDDERDEQYGFRCAYPGGTL